MGELAKKKKKSKGIMVFKNIFPTTPDCELITVLCVK